MNKFLRITLIVISVLIFLASFVLIGIHSSEKSTKNEIVENKTSSFETAMQDVKPFVVMFHSPWCSYCHQMMPSFKDLEEEYSGKYNFVLVDIDKPENKYIVTDYLPTSIPMMYIIDPKLDNRVLINSALFNYPQKLRAELDRYLRVRSMIK